MMIPEGYEEIHALDKRFNKPFLEFVAIAHRSGCRVAYEKDSEPNGSVYILITWDGRIYDLDDMLRTIMRDQRWLDKNKKGFIVAK